MSDNTENCHSSFCHDTTKSEQNWPIKSPSTILRDSKCRHRIKLVDEQESAGKIASWFAIMLLPLYNKQDGWTIFFFAMMLMRMLVRADVWVCVHVQQMYLHTLSLMKVSQCQFICLCVLTSHKLSNIILPCSYHNKVKQNINNINI